MATQTVEFRAAPGLTLTAKLFTPGSDTVVQTASAVTEATNRKGTYAATFTDPGAAEFELIALSGATPVCRWFCTLTLSTATFQAYEVRTAAVVARVTANTDQWGGVTVTGMPLPTASYTTPPTAGTIADAVWDESYSGHTTAGTFGKLMDTLRKANNIIEGTILATPTPTTTVFRISGADYPTGALEHAILWMSSGASQNQNSPILTTLNNGDGTVTVTLEEALVTAPSAGDTVLIDPTSHVHAIADIQSGLATSAAVAAVQSDVTTLLGRITSTLFSGITYLSRWLGAPSATCRGSCVSSGSALACACWMPCVAFPLLRLLTQIDLQGCRDLQQHPLGQFRRVALAHLGRPLRHLVLAPCHHLTEIRKRVSIQCDLEHGHIRHSRRVHRQHRRPSLHVKTGHLGPALGGAKPHDHRG